jgi:hypothetical protein
MHAPRWELDQVQAALGNTCKGAPRLRDLGHPKRRPEVPPWGRGLEDPSLVRGLVADRPQVAKR